MKDRKKAVALKYEKGYDAPVVTAAGMGYIADKIVEKAQEEDVPVIYNKELAELLNSVDVGSCIPSEVYEAVAKIIAYVMEIDSSKE